MVRVYQIENLFENCSALDVVRLMPSFTKLSEFLVVSGVLSYDK